MSTYNSEKMYTYLRGFFNGAFHGKEESQAIKALSYARRQHNGQTRKSGESYIVHPLSMACMAAAMQLRDDDIFAAILLHDVCEDCGVLVDNLPCNDRVKRIVKYLTKTHLPEESKEQSVQRYFGEMRECYEAVICKAIDRLDNLSSSAGIMSTESILKNTEQTEKYILPMLKEVKDERPEYSDMIYLLRTNLRSMCNALLNCNAMLKGKDTEEPVRAAR